MKILLVTPTHNYSKQYPSFLSFSDFPTGFGYLASALKQAGHEVYGLNPNNIIGYPNAYMMLQDVLSQKIMDVKPDLIGLGGLCVDYPFLKDAIQIIRDNTKSPIVLGGQIVTNDAEDIFDLLNPDFAVVGEGEEAIVNLVHDIGVGEGLKGLIMGGVSDINKLSLPDYEPFGVRDMIDNYSDFTRVLYRYSRTYPRPFSIVASRSCPFTCTFCVHGHRSTPYRARSIESIMEEIKVTYEKYHYNILILLDELFAVNKDRMVEFCKGVMNGKVNYGWDFDWMFQTHASAKLDLESLKMAKEAGCISFSYGLESASPTVLKSMNKRIEPEQVAEAIRLSGEAKVGFSANIILGDPAETPQTIAESLAFWFKYTGDSCVFLADLRPYPGSKVFDDALSKGLIKDKKTFYETIDSKTINLTSMRDQTQTDIYALTSYIETKWLFVKDALEVIAEMEPEGNSTIERLAGGRFVHLTVTCPHCGEKPEYRQHMLKPTEPFFLGIGCAKCHKKMRINFQAKGN